MNNGLVSSGQAFLSRLAASAQRHPRRVAAVLSLLLMTGGGGAFAVAQLQPTAADMPVHSVEYSVPSLASDISIADLVDGPGFTLYRSEQVRSGDSPETLLRRLGVADPAAAAFLRSNAKARNAIVGRTGRLVTAEATNDHQLASLTVRWAADDSDVFQRLTIRRSQDAKAAGKFDVVTEFVPLTKSLRLAGGIVRGTLYSATNAADVPQSVVSQLTDALADQVDLRKAIRPGARFSLVYETLEADGEILRSGRLLSAELRNAGKTYEAVWFQEDPQAKGGYYNFAGNSLQRGFSSPVRYTQVTSAFAMRIHPIHKTWQAHKGTDLAAPTGTPVLTVADGTVSFAGVQSGYGNVVFIDHANDQETVYAHLSRIDVKPGQKVRQGDEIGAVGQTGWATGPHLHFEFRVDGEQRDPLAMVASSTSAARPIAKLARPAFDKFTTSMRLALNAAEQSSAAGAE
ncbi:MAG: peptidoglycan DD-metalloendopeptidase family protein [Comamonas sp.]